MLDLVKSNWWEINACIALMILIDNLSYVNKTNITQRYSVIDQFYIDSFKMT